MRLRLALASHKVLAVHDEETQASEIEERDEQRRGLKVRTGARAGRNDLDHMGAYNFPVLEFQDGDDYF